jgi:hypothetical protein
VTSAAVRTAAAERRHPVRELGRRLRPWFRRTCRIGAEILVILLLGAGVCVLMDAQALRHPGTVAPGGVQDSLILAWAVAWAGHALRTDPSMLFMGNAFHPAPDSLAFTESLLGFAPLAMVGDGHQAALARFSLLFVFVPLIGFVGGYLLTRQLGGGRWGGLLVAAAFAFPPWRGQEGSHLHVTATGGVALALALLARGHGITARGVDLRRGRPLCAFLGWLVVTWQLAASLTVGVPLAYLLLLAGPPALVHLALRPRSWGWRLVLADLLGGAVLAVSGAALAQIYLRVQEQNSEAVQAARGVAIVQRYSPDWLAFLRPPPNSRFLSGVFADLPAPAGHPTIGALPGYTIAVLGLLGLAVSVWSWRRRLLLAALVAGTLLLAVGTTAPGAGRYTFLALYHQAPGWAAFRAPARLVAFSTLFLALLAAGFVARAARFLRGRYRGSRWWALGLVPLLALPAAALVEGAATVAYPTAPPPPAAFTAAPGPVLVVPSLWYFDSVPMWWSTDGFPELANGFSGFTPPTLGRLRAATVKFPDRASVDYLRGHGFRSVVVLGPMVSGTAWRRAADPVPPATLAELGLRRVPYGPDLLYLVEPG